MGDVTQFPDLGAENREAMIRGLRTLADALEQGIDDYDGVLVVGFYRGGEGLEIYPFNLYNAELSWIGQHCINEALSNHLSHYDED